MKTSHAVLVSSAVGAVAIWFAERRHRQRLALDTAHIHQRLLSDIAADPEHRAIWALEGLSDEESKHLLCCNRQVSFLSVKYRLGLLDKAGLRVQVRVLMEREPFRAYWQRSATFRDEEAGDRVDRSFNRVFEDEYAAMADADEAVGRLLTSA
ncbi:DUF6082 family protein [Streptomyces cathayae]|uniref:DUF6082 family protein n=1 Tax=Streptomyces cathayae TaxID=3031124 RepID=A0ABY8JVN3_9ACTN|nr:DUF6082 family protein [Streptomyces sp. HUAS 5]WGD39717.1 DUF6082 family protein [Streptomyces sp. HUAS 5]